MRDDQRIAEFVASQNVAPFEKLSPLSRPSNTNLVDQSDRDAAQRLLLQLRKRSDKHSGSGKRILTATHLSSKDFTLNERRDAFDNALHNKEPTGVAQAIMEFYPEEEFDVNIRQAKTPKVLGRILGKIDGQSASKVSPSRWLQIATEMGQKDYVRLLASQGPKQENLDESLRIALRRNSLPIMKELLRYGANPNTCSNEFQSQVGFGEAGIDFTGLLLNSSTYPLAQAERNKALVTAVECRSFSMVGQLLAFGADASFSSGQAFTSAAKLFDLRLLTLLVSASAYIEPESLQCALDHICEEVGLVHQTWVHFLDLLLSAGARTRPQILLKLLSSSAQENDMELVSLLVSHGEISPDHATKTMMGLLLDSSDETLEMCHLLFEAGAKGKELGAVLVTAVKQDCDPMIKLLVSQGVSLDYDNAIAVRIALQRPDIELLQLLLHGDGTILTSTHTKNILANALADALSITDRGKRHRAIELLLIKGVSGYALNQALHDAVVKSAIRDIVLIRALHEAGADVNHDSASPIQEALKLPDNNFLQILCSKGQISRNSFAIVLPLAIECSRRDQSKAKILLSHYHHSFQDEISKALVEEVRSNGGQNEILRLLLSHGADINYKGGRVLEETVSITPTSKSMDRLRLFLSKKPNETALNTAFDSVRNLQFSVKQRFDLFSMILDTDHQVRSIHKAFTETVSSHPNDTLIPDLLLRHGASVNYENGRALVSVAMSGNLQLLNNLMIYNPDAGSINAAFESASQAEIDITNRTEILKCLLGSRKVSSAAVTSALTREIILGRTDVNVLDLLTSHRGALEREALLYLVRNRGIDTAGLLLKSQTTGINIRSEAFHSSFELDRAGRLAFAKLLIPTGIESDVWTAALHRAILDRDHDLLRLLIKYRSGQSFKIGETLILAADTLDPDTIAILLQNGPSSTSRDCAFERMLRSGRMQRTDESRRAATMLLAQGVSQHLKDHALVYDLDNYGQHQSDFYKTLVQYQANVNTQACICFTLAGQFSDLEVFKYLLKSNPNVDQLVHTLVYSFTGGYDRLVYILQLTLTTEYCGRGVPDVRIVFGAMNRYPRGDKLIRLLLDHNYPAWEAIEIGGDESGGIVEAVTPLIWALSQRRPSISDAVIEELLREGKKARPEFATNQSNTTAICLAAQHRRHDIIEELIEMEVDVSVMDHHGKSPLFYAVSNQDLKSVGLLIHAKADRDDGSLHEAARLCHSGIVALLLNAKHNLDYSSQLHGGRTALGEMCLHANLDSRPLESQAIKTMHLLIGPQTDLTMRIEGKTVLHLALMNDRPAQITRALLRFPEVWRDLRTDSETFLYENAAEESISPNRYVTEYCRCSETLKRELQDILKNVPCKDKWYKKRGTQLANPVGLPEAMKKVQQEQDLLDQRMIRSIERRNMELQHDLEIEEKRSKARIKLDKEHTEAEFANRNTLHEQRLNHDNDFSIQRRENADRERTNQQNHAKKLTEIEHDGRVEDADLQTKLIADREAADQRIHDRAMLRIERQEECMMRVGAGAQKSIEYAPKPD